MISVESGVITGLVDVVTSDGGGLSSDQIAELARKKIVYVAEDAPLQLKNKRKCLRTGSKTW